MWYKINTPSGPYWTPFPPEREQLHAAPIVDESGDRMNAAGRQAGWLNLMTHKQAKLVPNSDGLIMASMTGESSLPPSPPPPGYYRFMKETYQLPARLKLAEYRTGESPVIMSSGVFQSVREDIQSFIDAKEAYAAAGAHWRMGVLMYGPPGNGKSTLIRQILQDHPGLANVIKITCSELPDPPFLESLSKLPGAKVFVFEELYECVRERDDMSSMLNFLDGENSVEGAIVLSTTNYPEKLPGNIVDRPSRFDKMYRFSLPNPAERRALLAKILGRDVSDDEVLLTKDFSAAYVREAALQMRVKGLGMKEVVTNLKRRMREIKEDFSVRQTMGLHGRHDNTESSDGPEDKNQAPK